MANWDNASILITGGTGSFGRQFIYTILKRFMPRRLVVFSRDEQKQYEMQQVFPTTRYPMMRYYIGDVRDRDRLNRALDGIDIVVHAAALKHIPTTELNPIEAIKTNIIGAANLIDACIDRYVKNVIALSSDKACNPVNLYGATKLCADKLFIAENSVTDQHNTRFSIVRYGNVVGSRGSVVPLFLSQKNTGSISITDPRMTRFVITLQQAVDFVIDTLPRMQGGEVFVPKIPSIKIIDLAECFAPECRQDVIGIRPGEKLHELLISKDDCRTTMDFGDYFAILPVVYALDGKSIYRSMGGRLCEESFQYRSDTNDRWISCRELQRMLADIG
jgi:UDP-N-acetylglucosamine 4,6-dehydratase